MSYSVYQKLSIAIVLTLATSSQGLLTTASKENGIYTYNFATVPFLAEAIKLVCIHI
jgi:UDP-sugar transporter A1/2/3